jgi:putative peptide zinc metalloprotease protein
MSMETPPRLRRHLRFMRHETGGTVAWVVKDPVALKYFRFGQIEAWLMQQMDGTRSLQQICDDLYSEIGMKATPAKLDVLVRRLRELGLVERTLQEKSAMLMDRLRAHRSTWRNNQNTILRMRWSCGDPDPWLERMVPALSFFWKPTFVVLSAIMFTIYGVLVALKWQPFADSIALLYSPSRVTLEVILIAYGSFTVTAIIHELGHALTCKRFGGEVHEIGAMILYFTPAFYCNVSDAWTFEKRSHRLWVTFAGGWIQLWCAAIATIVWALTEPGTFTNTVALFTAALGGAFSLFFNYNPLLPLDGYYALIDWLELPNLRARSFAYLGAYFRKHVLRLNAVVPAVTDRERRIFLIYGVLAGVYTMLALVVAALFVKHLLIPRFGAWGWVLFLSLLFALTGKPRRATRRLVRAVFAEKLGGGRMHRFAAAGALAVLLLSIGAWVTPWTLQAKGSAIVEPAQRGWLRAHQSARLVEVRVGEAAQVNAGDTIAVLRDPELELEHINARQRQQQLVVRATRARSSSAADERAASIELAVSSTELQAIERRRSALVLLAPFDGTVVTPRLQERLGEEIAAGDSVVEIWAHGPLRARLFIPQRAAGEMTQGALLRIRFPARPSFTWRTAIDRVESAADGSDLIATAQLPASAQAPLLPGMRGIARVDLARANVLRALHLKARRVLRLDFLL